MRPQKMIPDGYMTVGEIARKMKTTVRTLQYYDREGLLSPSMESEGGRRLYSDRDIIRLHQIQSLKYLGFSLEDIKTRLPSLNTPEEVAAVLTEQAAVIRGKIESLSEALDAVEKLKTETLQMDTVDFKTYADIIVLLQMKNDNYLVLKHFDEKTRSHIRNNFNRESGTEILETWKRLCVEISNSREIGLTPESERGQAIAKEWWDMVTAFTGGDVGLLQSVMKFEDSIGAWNEEWKTNYESAEPFIKKALEIYFKKKNINPFEGVKK